MSKEKVIEKLKERHEGEQCFTHTCLQNACWDTTCIVRSHVKDGILTAIETDCSINKGSGREDVSEDAIKKGMVQARGCAMSHAWKKEMYAPSRITYPMKRVGGKGFGNGYFEKISWEEALDTIASKITETIDQYGPYSILHSQYSFFRTSSFPLGPYVKAGVATWGDHSTSGHTPGEKFHLGYDLVKSLITGESDIFVGYEAPDLFNSKLIVLWGHNPLVGWFGPTSYYMKLAREKGIPIIVIDPRYTTSAEVLGDQWIPIRPGTDLAMMLAVAHVLYDEDLYDHAYVEKYVEPEGFAKWRNYIMGGTDGQPKTPEWAEGICTVPAETIRAFARLYASSQPVHLQYHYGAAKRHLGEYSASAAMLLQAMTGNLTIPGGCETGCTLMTPTRMPLPTVDFQKAPPEYNAPVCMNQNKFAEAILLRDDYEQGKITETEYRRAIGCAVENPLPNIKMLVFENNWLNNEHHVNKRLQAAEKVFSWGFMWHHNQPTAQWMDIVLPGPIHMFESTDTYLLGQQRFMSAPAGFRNYFLYSQKAVNPPGEIRPKDWVYTQLANRLGVGEKYNPLLKDVSWDKWDEEVEKLYQKGYEKWAEENRDYMELLGVNVKPWDEFLKDPVVRVPIEEPYHAYKGKLESGGNPFEGTTSGKVEFSSKYLETTDLRNTDYGGKMDPMPVWEPSYMNEPANDSFFHPKTRKYPLSLVTPVSIYRQHSCNDNNPLLRDDCYRHAVWMNPADAKARDINDNELVLVYNEYGEMVIPAYVTSKMMPGTASVHHGAWYQPNAVKTDVMPYGIDRRGACNLLIGDTHLPHVVGSLLVAGLVNIKKFGGEQ